MYMTYNYYFFFFCQVMNMVVHDLILLFMFVHAILSTE
nr:MAG TPA: hypothetical protein [Caudoviricetes sp.]